MSEFSEQVEFFKWAARQYQAHEDGRPEEADVDRGQALHLRLMFATLNGLLTHKQHAFGAVRAGARRGTPDVVVPPLHVGQPPLFVEFKPAKGGTVSSAQAWFLRSLNETGSIAVVAYGPERAAEAVRRYLRGESLDGLEGVRLL